MNENSSTHNRGPTLAAAPYDLIVVGSGIAGLYAALTGAPDLRVLLVTKGALEESNTRYAQGGIAAALDAGDSPELHMRDTVAAGDGLCDRAAVEILTREAPARILDLLRLGVQFDRTGERLAWALEAAHSRPRVLHAGGDATGASIERVLATLVRESSVQVLENALCVDLSTDPAGVRGVSLLMSDGRELSVQARAVILATGGAGQMYARTTNPPVATGDGAALAYRAGAQLMDLEFVQFHPTALALDGAPSFLISEAVRGEGGVLRDARGREFMELYHQDRELAPRDVVARAIHTQMIRTDRPCVWLDVTHLDRAVVERRFPSIVRFCRANGIDPVRDSIPVAPAAHYWMGGVRTDEFGRTSLPGLLACGEVACTGVHGANRLASNSLLEGLVFARRAVVTVVRDGATAAALRSGSGPSADLVEGAPIEAAGVDADAPPVLPRGRLADEMWREASLVRSEASLRRVAGLLADDTAVVAGAHGTLQLKTGGQRTAFEEDRNLSLISRLLVASALARDESRGAHFREDFPSKDPAWQAHVVVSRTRVASVPLAPRHPALAHG